MSEQGGVIFALLGLLFGSLASALSYRLPRGEPVLADRSRCPTCGTPLSARDLVPLLSWALARGRCRHCQAAVSWRYPLLELVMAGLFFAAWDKSAGDPTTAGLLALTGFGAAVIALSDLETGLIPDAMTVFMALLALGLRWHDHGDWIDGAAGAVIGFGAAWGIRLTFKWWRGRHGLGFGDVKFLGVAGLYLGLSGLGEFLILSGILGAGLGAIWQFSGRGKEFPFGPALCAALLAGLYRPWPLNLGLFQLA